LAGAGVEGADWIEFERRCARCLSVCVGVFVCVRCVCAVCTVCVLCPRCVCMLFVRVCACGHVFTYVNKYTNVLINTNAEMHSPGRLQHHTLQHTATHVNIHIPGRLSKGIPRRVRTASCFLFFGATTLIWNGGCSKIQCVAAACCL